MVGPSQGSAEENLEGREGSLSCVWSAEPSGPQVGARAGRRAPLRGAAQEEAYMRGGGGGLQADWAAAGILPPPAGILLPPAGGGDPRGGGAGFRDARPPGASDSGVTGLGLGISGVTGRVGRPRGHCDPSRVKEGASGCDPQGRLPVVTTAREAPLCSLSSLSLRHRPVRAPGSWTVRVALPGLTAAEIPQVRHSSRLTSGHIRELGTPV